MDTLTNGLITIITTNTQQARMHYKPASKLLGRVLRIMQLNGYIGELNL